MTGYTPKPGDRIRATKVHEVTVSKVTDDGQIVTTAGRWFHPEVFDIELVEAAPVPFVVGQPITPEMGEPPEWSVIGHAAGPFWNWTKRGLWHGPNSETRTWDDLYDGPRTTLLRLGDGSGS